jgi:hypothetical protein
MLPPSIESLKFQRLSRPLRSLVRMGIMSAILWKYLTSDFVTKLIGVQKLLCISSIW